MHFSRAASAANMPASHRTPSGGAKSRAPSSTMPLASAASAALLFCSVATAPPGALALSATPAGIAVAGARCLGGTDLVVSEACLGTMTYGVQNDDADAFRQLDYARKKGCNFVDTAELYPVPLTAKEWRAGATEDILGSYLDRIGPQQRDDLVVATKVCGYFPNSPVAAARYEPPRTDPAPDGRLDAQSVRDACHASLRRLRTDRIDLLQVHWPDRYIPVFGNLNFRHEMKRDGDVPIMETAAALRDLIEEGKVRYIGISNESSLGVCEWVNACEKLGIRDKLATIQNSYSLLDRRFDSELAETCDYHDIGLLPWSVLAGGLLSGKYVDGQSRISTSANDRFTRFPEYMQRWSPKSATSATLAATDRYAKIAEEAGMTPSELAIAFVRSRRFVADNGSVIVGSTTMEQLEENLAPFDGRPMAFDESLLEAIDEVHMSCRDPCCAL